MGTNYYAVKRKPTISNPIHIGKSSGGWLFLFKEQDNAWLDDAVWHTYEQVKEWLYKNVVETEEYVILDEYDREITFEDFFEIVDHKQKDEHNLSNPDNFAYCKNVNGYRFSDRDFS